MKIIRKIDEFIARFEGWMIVIILGALTLFSALDVFLGLFGSGLSWINRFFGYSMLWLAFIGASVATHEGQQINIDIFSRVIPKQAKQYVFMVIHLVGAWISFVFAREAFGYITQIEMGSSEVLFSIGFDVETWILYTIMPISFLGISLRYVLAALNNFLYVTGMGGEAEIEFVPMSESFESKPEDDAEENPAPAEDKEEK